MKRFEELFQELKEKVASGDPSSGTVRAVENGTHAIGKKIIEEAGEVWMAARFEGKEETAEEICQLLYHIEVMMMSCEIGAEEINRYLYQHTLMSASI